MGVITPDKSRGVGFRHGQIMMIDADGYPAAPSTEPYIGMILDGGKQLTINDPDVRRIVHPGDDVIKAVDFLPPNEAMTAELQVSGSDFDLDAALAGLKVFTVGESKRMLHNTEKKGSEPDVMALFYQQSLTGGRRSWRYFVMPSAQLIVRQSGMDDNAEVRTYPVNPRIVTYDEFGMALMAATHGATETQLIPGIARGKPFWHAFKADGTETDFVFDPKYQAINTGCIRVSVDGADLTTGVTKAVDKVTFTVAPIAGKKVCVWSEVA